MLGGTWEQKPADDGIQFDKCSFDGVRLKGDLYGFDFGSWDNEPDTFIRSCDFSAAVLIKCRFINTSMDSLTMPSWPTFTVTNPSQVLNEILALNLPSKIAFEMELACDVPPEVSFVADNLDLIAEAEGITAEEVAELLKARFQCSDWRPGLTPVIPPRNLIPLHQLEERSAVLAAATRCLGDVAIGFFQRAVDIVRSKPSTTADFASLNGISRIPTPPRAGSHEHEVCRRRNRGSRRLIFHHEGALGD
ncbi:MAG: hypothetical protein AAGN82_30970, partial [Myxococcota bacterium]